MITNVNNYNNVYNFNVYSPIQSNFENNINVNNVNIYNINIYNPVNAENTIAMQYQLMQLQWLLIQLLMILLGGEGTDQWNRMHNNYGRYFGDEGNVYNNFPNLQPQSPQLQNPPIQDSPRVQNGPRISDSPSGVNQGPREVYSERDRLVDERSNSTPPGQTSDAQRTPDSRQTSVDRQQASQRREEGERYRIGYEYESGVEVGYQYGDSQVKGKQSFRTKGEAEAEWSRGQDETGSYEDARVRGEAESEIAIEGEYRSGDTSIRGRVSRKVEGHGEIEGNVTTSEGTRRAKFGAGVGVSETNSGRVEVESGDSSAYVQADQQSSAEAGVKAEYIEGGGGVYVEGGIGGKFTKKEGVETGAKIEDSGVSVRAERQVEAKAVAEAKLGYGVGREKAQGRDEIVAKAGARVSAEASVGMGFRVQAAAESSEGYIKGGVSLSKNEGVGGTIGYASEARIDTNSWNLKFSTVIDSGIKVIKGFEVGIDFEGQVGLQREISELRNELEQRIAEEEQRIIQNQMNQANQTNQTNQANQTRQQNQTRGVQNQNLDRNQIRQRAREVVLSNVPNWQSKLQVIRSSVEQKTHNILTAFSNKAIDRLAEAIERGEINPEYLVQTNSTGENNRGILGWIVQNTSRAFGVNTFVATAVRALKGLVGFKGFLLSKIINLLTPTISMAIYEIKPQDVVKS
ncbi:MAG: hypothetical protein ABDH21_01945 [bacterium]